MKSILRKGSIAVVLGTGGVGKTTVAAALAMCAARDNLDTAVVTVDPAPRLRDALGLESLGGDPVRIPSRMLTDAGLDGRLKLSAMMLDVKGAWDGLIERFVADPAARARVFANPFYQSLSAEFAGADAFAAIQRIYDLHQSARFDFEVVDTPPAVHAFDFIEAPARMIRLLDSRAARMLFAPSMAAGRFAMRIAGSAARLVTREIERFTGAGWLTTIADFIGAIADSLDAIIDRIRKTGELMRSPDVSFVMVTTAERDRLAQAADIIRQVRKGGLRLDAIIVNRFLDETTWTNATSGARSPLSHIEALDAVESAMASKVAMRPLLAHLRTQAERTLEDIARVASFAQIVPRGVRLGFAPEIRTGAANLAAIDRVADYLTRDDMTIARLSAAARKILARSKD